MKCSERSKMWEKYRETASFQGFKLTEDVLDWTLGWNYFTWGWWSKSRMPKGAKMGALEGPFQLKPFWDSASKSADDNQITWTEMEVIPNRNWCWPYRSCWVSEICRSKPTQQEKLFALCRVKAQGISGVTVPRTAPDHKPAEICVSIHSHSNILKIWPRTPPGNS